MEPSPARPWPIELVSSPAMIGLLVDQSLDGFRALGPVGVVLLEAVALYIGSGLVTRIAHPVVRTWLPRD